jgi:hypothetical protein
VSTATGRVARVLRRRKRITVLVALCGLVVAWAVDNGYGATGYHRPLWPFYAARHTDLSSDDTLVAWALLATAVAVALGLIRALGSGWASGTGFTRAVLAGVVVVAAVVAWRSVAPIVDCTGDCVAAYRWPLVNLLRLAAMAVALGAAWSAVRQASNYRQHA